MSLHNQASPADFYDDEAEEATPAPSVRPTAIADLAAGDVAVVALRADAPDGFRLVALAPLPGGARVHVTDDAWDGAAGAFRGSEGTMTYAVPDGGLPAGTVLGWAEGADDDDALVDGWSETGAFSLSASGDQLLIYVGTEANPTFLFALTTQSGGAWSADGDAVSSATSALPRGLADGATALALDHKDNWAYGGSTTSGTRDEVRW